MRTLTSSCWIAVALKAISSESLPQLPIPIKRGLSAVRSKGDQIRSSFDAHGPLVNLSGLFRPATSIPGYLRGGGVPVYMVTTPWGSPYMLSDKSRDFIRSVDLDEDIAQNFLGDEGEGNVQEEEESGGRNKKSKSDKPSRPSRSIAPIFTDPRDAETLLAEMSQMGGLDVRITATSMARALRQCSVLGRGMPTGAISSNGNLEGYLRYKIVPSSRELYYASQCTGRECVGFPSEEEDAAMSANAVGRRVTQVRAASQGPAVDLDEKDYGPVPRWATPFEFLGRKSMSELRLNSKKAQEDIEKAKKKNKYDFMKDGRKGIPVFYADGLQLPRRGLVSRVKGVRNGEVPMFFSYEDCVQAWKDMRQNTLKNREKEIRKQKTSETIVSVDEIPALPPKIEVFNYVDVITSIDREQHKRQVQQYRARSLKNLLSGNKSEIMPRSTIEEVVFIPSTKSVDYKEAITRSGNCKARIRPMR